MAAQRQDFAIDVGGTFDQVLRFENPDGSPFDFSGFTGQMQIRDGYAGDVVLEMTTEDGGMVLAGGSMTLVLDPVDTTDEMVPPSTTQTGVPAKTFVHDIWIFSGPWSGKVIYGETKITGRVTR
jgi:hypothetical protein